MNRTLIPGNMIGKPKPATYVAESDRRRPSNKEGSLGVSRNAVHRAAASDRGDKTAVELPVAAVQEVPISSFAIL
jgi:hypothetical protein